MAAPALPEGLYDRDLSQASLAAAQAIADLQERPEPWSGLAPQDHPAHPCDGDQPLPLLAPPPPLMRSK